MNWRGEENKQGALRGVSEKQIRATKIGQWRVKPEDLQEFIKSRSNV